MNNDNIESVLSEVKKKYDPEVIALIALLYSRKKDPLQDAEMKELLRIYQNVIKNFIALAISPLCPIYGLNAKQGIALVEKHVLEITKELESMKKIKDMGENH